MKTSFLRENIFILSILCIIFIISFYDVVFLGKTFKLTTANPQALITGPYGQENNRPSFFPVHGTDVPIFEEGTMQFIKTSFQNGIFPLWNPHQGCGTPLVAMMQTGIFFPLNLILYLLPNIISWDIHLFFRFLLSGLLAYWFMRSMKFKRIPALGSSIAFMLSAPMIFMHWSMTQIDILLPLVLIVIDRLIRKASLRNAGLFAIVISLTCFGGHPERVFLVNTYGLIFFIFRVVSLKKTNQLVKISTYMIIAYLWGFCLSAIVLLPFLQNWLTEFWHAHANYIGAVPEGLPTRDTTLINFIMPAFFQKEIVTLGFERSTFWGHIGVIPLGLAFLSLFSKQKKGLNYFFAGMALFIFTKCFINFPLTNWIGYLPLARSCRFVHHSQHLFAFSIMILSGMGIRYLMLQKKIFWKGALYAGVIFLCAGLTLFTYRNAEHFNLSLESFLFLCGVLFLMLILFFLKDKKFFPKRLFAVIVVTLLTLELFLYIPRKGRVNRFESFPPVPYVEYLKKQPNRSRTYGIYWTLYPNTASGYHVDDLGLVEGLMMKRYVRFINNFIFPNYFTKGKVTSAFWVIPVTFMSSARPYLDLLNVKYTVAPTSLHRFFPAAENPKFPKPDYANEVLIYAHPPALPRAFIVHKAIFEPDETRSIKKMKQLAGGFDKFVLLQHEPLREIQQKLQNTPFQSDSSASITRYTPNNVEILAHMTAPGFLVLSDSYHPDWKVYVDGKPSQLFLADTFLRAVFVPAGDHTIQFIFLPFWFFIGLILTASTLIMTFLFMRIKEGNNSRSL